MELPVIELEEEKRTLPSSDEQVRTKPSQMLSETKIVSLEKHLNALYAARDTLSTNDVEKQIVKVREQLKKEKQSLKRKKQNVEYQKKHRENKKRALEEICHENPDIKNKLSMRESVGRPSLEQDQPLLLKTIADIAIFGSAVDARRRTETIRSIKTLDELVLELKKIGFTISRSGTYLRLMPKNSTTVEGRRHVSTVPVKLSRAQTDLHHTHVDSQFATASIHYLESLASILGPAQVLFLSQDDKARVPIGLTAANKQAPLLMHMEYRVSLPDHDWVVAERHKLIPSVYAGIEIKPMTPGNPQAVGYSGPTFIAIRSGKHSSSTANTHAQDFETLLNIDEFQSLVRTEDGSVKPVVIMTVDGGPDENPRYRKVIAFAIRHFKMYNLDALFIATNAPGRSAFNRVERRMAPLSRELAGLILPHDHFGSHLDDKGCTVNVDLEKSNFEFAGKVLAEIWSTMNIDGHPVHATYVNSGEPELPVEEHIKWYSDHVRESQYLLQIVKCKNETCCLRPRSGIFKILKSRYLPPPAKMNQTSHDLIVSDEGEFLDLSLRLALDLEISSAFIQLPYDYFCPTVKPKLSKRICQVCGHYNASNKSADRHRKNIHGNDKQNVPQTRVRPLRIAARRANELMCIIQALNGDEDVEWLEKEEVEEQGPETCNTPGHCSTENFIIDNVETWVQGSWTSN